MLRHGYVTGHQSYRPSSKPPLPVSLVNLHNHLPLCSKHCMDPRETDEASVYKHKHRTIAGLPFTRRGTVCRKPHASLTPQDSVVRQQKPNPDQRKRSGQSLHEISLKTSFQIHRVWVRQGGVLCLGRAFADQEIVIMRGPLQARTSMSLLVTVQCRQWSMRLSHQRTVPGLSGKSGHV